MKRVRYACTGTCGFDGAVVFVPEEEAPPTLPCPRCAGTMEKRPPHVGAVYKAKMGTRGPVDK
jgi:hypothetical protein